MGIERFPYPVPTAIFLVPYGNQAYLVVLDPTKLVIQTKTWARSDLSPVGDML